MTAKKLVLDIDTIHAAAVADEQHAFADEATQSVFGSLAASTKGYTNREQWEEGVRKVEDEYMEKVHGKNPDAKTKGRQKKDGTIIAPSRWKYRTYLPAAWSSSKSVCGQAIEHGIKMDEDSKKTATEQAIKEIKAGEKVEKTPEQKFDIALDTAKKVLMNIPDNKRDALSKKYGVDFTNSYWSN
jgi:hypothetical protein